MAIRKKLLLLLLAIALTPLAVIFIMRQISFRMARQQIVSRMREALDRNSELALQQLLENYNQVQHGERQLLESLIRRQAREVEIRLSQEPVDSVGGSIVDDYGFDPALEKPTQVKRDHLFKTPPSEGDLSKISYCRQGYFLAEGASKSDVEDDMHRLWGMTGIYHELYKRASESILRQHTSLENGLHTSYPDGGEPPNSKAYDPRKRDWYVRAKENRTVVVTGPMVDASTGQTVMTLSMPVLRPNGSLAGVTAIDKMVSDIFEKMNLPQRWAEGAERMMVAYSPVGSSRGGELVILLQASNMDVRRNRQQAVELQKLQSEDKEEFFAMVGDIEAGTSGVRKMEYRGKLAIWAYGSPKQRPVFPVLIVPYDRVIELADSMEQYLLGENAQWRTVTGVILLVVFGTAVTLGVVRARSLTQPIIDLTEASRRLAEGDFNSQVDIRTGDELQQLGEVFNKTGPKLRERERIKRSLELARTIQQNLLPRESPKLETFDLAGQCKYCDETGGDYYDFITLTEPGKIGIALGDVTGHGIGAALLMATARSILRSNAARYQSDLSTLLEVLNRQLAMDTDYDKFMTLFYAVLHEEDRSIIWASGGHDPAFWYHKGTGKIEELPNTGFPIGLMEDASFEQGGPVRLEAGDVLVIGTDGIWEAQNEDGDMFSKERLCGLIRDESERSADDICSAVIDAVTTFCGSSPQLDDITLVVTRTR